MARRREPIDLDRLYQAPLGDFVSERNALAKSAGEHAAAVRELAKPTLPAWAVNQLYWRHRPLFDDLVARAADLRATHQAALRGDATDLRGASRAHEEAVDEALTATLTLLTSAGHPLTDATRQAIATTLRALPSDEAPGRLSKPLQPRGFDVFGAAGAAGVVRTATPPPQTAKAAHRKGAAAAPEGGEAARRAAAHERARIAARALRDAEHAAKREEFEVARTAREREKAARRLGLAEAGLEEAQEELDQAKAADLSAAKAHEQARARAETTAAVLEEAREAEQAARAEL